MKIKTKELKDFLITACDIKPNPVAIIDDIKIECTGQEIIFTKTNNNIWVKYSYVCQPCEPECLLVNERMLNGVAVTSKEYEIEIYPNITRELLHIVSGEDLIKTGIRDLKSFPVIQEAIGEKVRISKEALERIRIAAKYISTAPNKTAMNFVHIGLNGIFACNPNTVYYHNTFPLPEVFFDEEPLGIIKSTDDMLYWTSPSYDFFQMNGFTFGFIKRIVPPINYLPIVQQTGTEYFTVKRDDLIDFCTLVQYSKRKDSQLATFFSLNDKTLCLRFEDGNYNINIVRNVAIESNVPIDSFTFTVDLFSSMIKTLPYEYLTFTKLDNGHYGITTTNDEGYKGIIIRLQEK